MTAANCQGNYITESETFMPDKLFTEFSLLSRQVLIFHKSFSSAYMYRKLHTSLVINSPAVHVTSVELLIQCTICTVYS